MKRFTAMIFAVFFTFSTNALEIKGDFSGVTYENGSFGELAAGQQVTGNIAIHLSPTLISSVGYTPSETVLRDNGLNWIDMSIQVGESLFDFVLDPSIFFGDELRLNNPLGPNGAPSLNITTWGKSDIPFAAELASLTLNNFSEYLFDPSGMTCTENCGFGTFVQLNTINSLLPVMALFTIDNFNLGPVNPIPEPSTLLLFAFGLLGLRRVRF